MSKFKTQYVVIDADVARSAGEAHAPISTMSRRLLMAVAEAGT